MEYLNNKRGITLVALVITIIVMLILITVTVSIAINGKLFEYAKQASGETRKVAEREKAITSIDTNLTIDEIIDFVSHPILVPLYGDANDDGEVSILDVSAAYLYIGTNFSEIDEQKRINTDVNLDKVIDMRDINIMVGYFSNQISMPYTGAVYGDINLDGIVNSQDLDEITNYYEGEDTGTPSTRVLINADVNLDNHINTNDRTLIQRYINGEVSELPYTGN